MQHHLTTSPCCYQGCFGQMRQNRQMYMQCRSSLRRVWINTGRRLRQKQWRFSGFVQFMFGIHHLPEASMYWSSDPLLRVSAIADVISKNQFEKLSQYFHLNDNLKAAAKDDPNYDPLFKVRPLLEQVRSSSHAHYHPGKHISIDEVMIKFNGRLSFKQYIKGVYWTCNCMAMQTLFSLLDYLFLLPNRGWAGGYDTHIKCNDTCSWKNIVYLHLFYHDNSV